MEKQTIYGWPVALDLFLSGSGAGAFLGAFILNLSGPDQGLIKMILFAGPFLVASGIVFLLADLTIRSRVYRLFANLKSWTSRGTWILTGFFISSLGYSFISLQHSGGMPPSAGVLQIAAGLLAALFSLLVLIYPGFLMGSIQAIPFWSAPALPVLFLLSGLVNGTTFIILALLLFSGAFQNDIVALLHMLAVAASILICLQAAALQFFYRKADRGAPASRESMRHLRASRFIYTMFILGQFIPLLLFILGFFTSQLPALYILSSSAAVLSLAGGLYLRYAIIQAGVFLPRFTLSGDRFP